MRALIMPLAFAVFSAPAQAQTDDVQGIANVIAFCLAVAANEERLPEDAPTDYSFYTIGQDDEGRWTCEVASAGTVSMTIASRAVFDQLEWVMVNTTPHDEPGSEYMVGKACVGPCRVGVWVNGLEATLSQGGHFKAARRPTNDSACQ